MEQQEMNINELENTEIETINTDAGVNKDTLVKCLFFLAGVATPFVVKGAIKLGKKLVEKIREKKEKDAEDFENFSDFEDEN